MLKRRSPPFERLASPYSETTSAYIREPMPSPEPQRTLRADARENREKLLRAASSRFASAGSDVALETIARAAGVGIGTLYRHFPTRQVLIEAVYRSEVDRLCASAGELLA